MLKKVEEYVIENKLIKAKDKILVALSGGPDSVCLLHILYKLKEVLDIEIGAIHINHLLRGEESEGDERYIKDLCDKLGIKYYVKRIDIKYIANSTGVSLEVAGRNERYKAFEEIRNEYNYNKVAVAHNANDQAETVLMRMMRGTGLEGLTGIKAKRKDGIIRPILCLNRYEIEKYCEDNELKPRIDASNYERVYSRNKVRLDILPYMKENFNKDIIETLNRMVLLLQKDNEFIEEYSKKCYDIYCSKKNDAIIIRKEIFKDELEAINTRVVKMAFKKVSKSDQNFEMKHIYKIIELSNGETGKQISLTNNIVCENIYGDVLLSLKDNNKKTCKDKFISINKEKISDNIEFENYIVKFNVIDSQKKIEFSKDDLIKFFDYDKIKKEIIIRNRRDGDKIIPLGMNGSKKIKDIFIDLKIPREERGNIPIVCFDDKIAWVVGLKTSQEYKVTNSTKKILKIMFDKRG